MTPTIPEKSAKSSWKSSLSALVRGKKSKTPQKAAPPPPAPVAAAAPLPAEVKKKFGEMVIHLGVLTGKPGDDGWEERKAHAVQFRAGIDAFTGSAPDHLNTPVIQNAVKNIKTELAAYQNYNFGKFYDPDETLQIITKSLSDIAGLLGFDAPPAFRAKPKPAAVAPKQQAKPAPSAAAVKGALGSALFQLESALKSLAHSVDAYDVTYKHELVEGGRYQRTALANREPQREARKGYMETVQKECTVIAGILNNPPIRSYLQEVARGAGQMAAEDSNGSSRAMKAFAAVHEWAEGQFECKFMRPS